jgi:hypothetical protein
MNIEVQTLRIRQPGGVPRFVLFECKALMQDSPSD